MVGHKHGKLLWVDVECGKVLFSCSVWLFEFKLKLVTHFLLLLFSQDLVEMVKAKKAAAQSKGQTA